MSEAAIAAEAEASPFQALLGYRLAEWEPDRAVVVCGPSSDHLNRTGRLHGGLLATLLDTAAGYAGCYSADPAARRACVTLSLTVSFLAPAGEGGITVEARRTGGGRSVFFAEARARDRAGTLVATAAGTFRYLHERSGGAPA